MLLFRLCWGKPHCTEAIHTRHPSTSGKSRKQSWYRRWFRYRSSNCPWTRQSSVPQCAVCQQMQWCLPPSSKCQYNQWAIMCLHSVNLTTQRLNCAYFEGKRPKLCWYIDIVSLELPSIVIRVSIDHENMVFLATVMFVSDNLVVLVHPVLKCYCRGEIQPAYIQ